MAGKLRSPNYRQDIQVLRSVAVIAVVAYHAGLQVPGGFMGVDVFFVVSGYVIARLILREFENEGHVSYVKFLARRVRRLFPALAVVVTFSVLGSLLVFPRFTEASPGIYTGVAGIFSLANISAALLEFDYFAAPSKENFMLHLWSLSVEEQFYLVFPIAFLLLLRFRKRALQGVLLFLALSVSLGIAIFGQSEAIGLLDRGQALVGFYSPLSRAWQFLAGALLVFLPHLSMTGATRKLLTAAAWLSLLFSFFASSAETSNLAVQALLPVAATALIIYLGGEKGASNSRLVILEKIGDLSYSLYLWHWPLIVFSSVLFPASFTAPIIAAAMSAIPAYISFKTVEQRIRFSSANSGKKTTRTLALLLLTAFSASTIAWALFPTVQSRVEAYALDGDLNEDEYYKELARINKPCEVASGCVQSIANKPPEILILGNSHGAHLFVGLSKTFHNKNVVWLSGSAATYRNSEVGAEFRSLVDESSTLQAVVIGELYSKPGTQETVRDYAALARYLQSKNIRLLLPNGSPWLEVPAYKCKYGTLLNPSAHRCFFPAKENNSRHGVYSAYLESIEREFDNVEIVDTYSLFCDENLCKSGDAVSVWFRDLNHFGLAGSKLVGEKFLSEGVIR